MLGRAWDLLDVGGRGGARGWARVPATETFKYMPRGRGERHLSASNHLALWGAPLLALFYF